MIKLNKTICMREFLNRKFISHIRTIYLHVVISRRSTQIELVRIKNQHFIIICVLSARHEYKMYYNCHISKQLILSLSLSQIMCVVKRNIKKKKVLLIYYAVVFSFNILVPPCRR